MKFRSFHLLTVTGLLILSQSGWCAISSARWTQADDTDASFAHVLQVANQKLGLAVPSTDFKLEEEQILGAWKFQMWHQLLQGLPVEGANIRVWKNISDDQLVQVEAFLANPQSPQTVQQIKESRLYIRKNFSRTDLHQLLQRLQVKKFRSEKIQEIWHPQWGPVRRIRIFAGTYSWEVLQSLKTGEYLSSKRKDYPRGDAAEASDEFEVPASIFLTSEEIYENGVRKPSPVPRQNVTLKYLKKSIPFSQTNLLGEFQNQIFASSKEDPVKGLTEEGRAQGFWSATYLKQKIAADLALAPLANNDPAGGRTYLSGRYVTVQIHPDGMAQFHPSFPVAYGPGAMMNWSDLPPINGEPQWGLSILPTYMGLPGHDAMDFLKRPAPWRENATPETLMNEGFDEVQVYWTVNQWFETLHDLGFQDPQISTRPITAILFNPDIEARNNAFYDSDTINFTTYVDAPNYARDAGTIWHELGHGLEDRILNEANYDGGLSEGMADLCADILLNYVTEGIAYPQKYSRRIVNQMGFNLTNEEHDMGEAYGGTLFELSEQILKAEGMKGLRKFADLFLDGMRLSRNSPALDVQAWFQHLLYADQLGKAGLRQPGEFATRLNAILKERNFSFNANGPATFPIQIDGLGELDSHGLGSRNNPVRFDLKANETKQFHLKVKVQDGQETQLKYPVTVQVVYRGGPLQGSAKFLNEEQAVNQTIQKSGDEIDLPITVLAGCDEINRTDHRCSDFTYLKLYNSGEKSPIGKKRFYVNVNAL